MIMHVVHQEHPLAEAGEHGVHRRPVKARSSIGCRAFESIQHAHLVPVGLQSANKPRAGVGQSLVVDVDGILRRQHHSETERARLLEQGQQRLL